MATIKRTLPLAPFVTYDIIGVTPSDLTTLLNGLIELRYNTSGDISKQEQAAAVVLYDAIAPREK